MTETPKKLISVSIGLVWCSDIRHSPIDYSLDTSSLGYRLDACFCKFTSLIDKCVSAAFKLLESEIKQF